MIIKKIKTYKLDELSKETQEKIITNLYDINVDFEWWDFVCSDAENIGLKITGFDIGRRNSISIEYIYCSITTKRLILKNHEKDCDTYKTVLRHDLRVMSSDEDMLYALGEDYLLILKKEYEYLTSEESIKETILCNDYDFTIEGKIF